MDPCRYCLETTCNPFNRLVKPCNCTSRVHEKCLEKWTKTRNTNKCEICLSEFKIQKNYLLECIYSGMGLFFIIGIDYFRLDHAYQLINTIQLMYWIAILSTNIIGVGLIGIIIKTTKNQYIKYWLYGAIINTIFASQILGNVVSVTLVAQVQFNILTFIIGFSIFGTSLLLFAATIGIPIGIIYGCRPRFNV